MIEALTGQGIDVRHACRTLGVSESETFDDSLKVIFAHIDKIAAITGGYRHLAIGTDFDGFIKPTMTGLDNMAELTDLKRALEDKYHENANLIMSENALRVLRQLWS